MSGLVHLSAPDVGPLEESYLIAALRSGWVAPIGPDLEEFEREIASRVGTRGAVAVSSGTAALHLGLLGVGVSAGDAVVVPTLTFVATANAVRYTGARPVFVDCDPGTGNIDVLLLAEALDRLRGRGERVGAVVPVDMFGSCADYTRLLPICAEAGVPVVEDAAEALGATHRGRPAGSFGRVGALSFNGNKIMTTSGGGMLVSDDLSLLARARHLATQAREQTPHYEHRETGYNYRLSNLLAALGRAQLVRLDGMIGRRRRLRNRYAELFASVPGVELVGAADDTSNCWLTVIRVRPDRAGWQAAELAEQLRKRDIETRPVWKPMHQQPAFAGAESVLSGAADDLFVQGLTLPSGSALTEPQISTVLAAIGEFLSARIGT
ncbi:MULTISPECIES: DegT/DnrJ/EryC1/StrS aminotransferase family protein [Micromonospora]|uniref:DegT/DnrJ/EryC1/StrS family aminotransferase n=1 Tax=Micromonospora TaxID=1873 RepID=UPI0003EEA8EB|nr:MULTISPECIES: aminotransferase class I/II-fold pyridoxal phosphate-dependent enzyme [unclassified Micromonospora]EWM64628.1 DegT/DnrJ/EryC1/StrS aminotransferase [Micromonospora sp. M42]MCK1806113.1 aminotransferase class I/II-fold pyridoxal phosphate-dependent enzyme [Micromonospora sp. R42106]MCK1830691.1 aminotransferase class I/II-fold pyridoxal phosphate-dependent enzyme [Micromonospora sp. R42003]MCK1843440.1 aminotransferase class I/II-fold pyridoxal phosphate-dependent enzyme [Microm